MDKVRVLIADDHPMFRRGLRSLLDAHDGVAADQVEILHAVQAVARGEAIFGATVAARIIEFFAAPRRAPISSACGPATPASAARAAER